MTSIGKTLIESPGATKIIDKLGKGQKKKVDELLEQIARRQPGKNIHNLKHDLKGKFAADVPGSGKGRGKLRLILEDTPDGIIIHDIIDYHKK